MTDEKKPELTTQKMRDIAEYSQLATHEATHGAYDDKFYSELVRVLLDQTSVRGGIYQKFADFEIQKRKEREEAAEK
jgi:hypothetical protein